MSSYYAKIGSVMGGGERLVAVTGRLQNGLMRVVDVDVSGNPLGAQSYVPSNVPLIEMEKSPQGYLVEAGGQVEEEIDWAAHEDKVEYNEDGEPEVKSEVSSVSPTNPALAGFPELQGE